MKRDTLAEVILPLSVRGTFTYRIPEDKADKISPGLRVAVSFGNKKLYSGIISEIRGENEDENITNYKEIGDILDNKPVIYPLQLGLWEWISEYYMCYKGEVMRAAIPSGLCLESETILRPNPEFQGVHKLDTDELRLFNTIENRANTSLKTLPKSLNERSTLKLINGLVMKNALITGQSLKEKYRPKEEPYVIMSSKYTDYDLNKYLDDLKKAPKQQAVLSAYIRVTGYSSGSDLFPVKRSVLLRESGALPSSLNTLIKKGILVSLSLETSRLKTPGAESSPLANLTPVQMEAMEKTRLLLKEKGVVLLHGVTSSGKTEIYIHLIEEQLRAGRQVLYLLPEISLATHIIDRLSKHFGNKSAVYHSRLSDAEQVEIWNRVAGAGKKESINLIIGARSAIFLPFSKPGLIIVDEEHDSSFKQTDPSPRYNARDTSIMLGVMAGANVLLGSATPSLETYHNARTGKYGLVEIRERYGNVNMPEIILADTRDAARKKGWFRILLPGSYGTSTMLFQKTNR